MIHLDNFTFFNLTSKWRYIFLQILSIFKPALKLLLIYIYGYIYIYGFYCNHVVIAAMIISDTSDSELGTQDYCDRVNVLL